MTIFWIFLAILTLAFFLLYPVVVMTSQFRHECLAISFGSGVSNPPMENSPIENLISIQNQLQILEDDASKKGYQFEQFIVSKFSKEYFSLSRCRGDKYSNGIYPMTDLEPGLVYNFRCKDRKIEFAIESRWRRDFYDMHIVLGKDYQITKYNEFQYERNIPVFVVIGIGGIPAKPEDLYIIPLGDLKTSNLHLNFMRPYKRLDPEKMFFFEPDSLKLK